MSLELLGVEGLTIDHDTGSNVSGGTFTITSIASLKVKCEGKGVYKGTLSFTFSGGTCSGPPPDSGSTAVGSGTINITALKSKVEGDFVIREGDIGTMSGTYVATNPSPPPATIPGVFTNQPVKITDAGQTKVLGE